MRLEKGKYITFVPKVAPSFQLASDKLTEAIDVAKNWDKYFNGTGIEGTKVADSMKKRVIVLRVIEVYDGKA